MILPVERGAAAELGGPRTVVRMRVLGPEMRVFGPFRARIAEHALGLRAYVRELERRCVGLPDDAVNRGDEVLVTLLGPAQLVFDDSRIGRGRARFRPCAVSFRYRLFPDSRQTGPLRRPVWRSGSAEASHGAALHKTKHARGHGKHHIHVVAMTLVDFLTSVRGCDEMD